MLSPNARVPELAPKRPNKLSGIITNIGIWFPINPVEDRVTIDAIGWSLIKDSIC